MIAHIMIIMIIDKMTVDKMTAVKMTERNDKLHSEYQCPKLTEQ